MTLRMVSLAFSLLLATAAQADIRVGVVGSMSGQYAAYGEQVRRGMEMAVADINAKGGLLGQKVVLEVGDDQCDAQKAVPAAKEMVNKKVVFVNGHDCSDTSIPASDIYSQAGILQISPAATNPAFTDRQLKNVLRVCGRDDQQGLVAGAYIATRFKNQNIAILHDNTTYGKGLADETKKTMNKLGTKESMYEAITPGAKDYSELVKKLKAANIGLIYLGGYHTEAAAIAREVHAQGMKTRLMSGDALVTDEFWTIAGPAGEGVLMTFGPDPTRELSAVSVVRKFVQQGYKPEGSTLYAYGATQVWAQAVKQAGSTKAADVAKVLKSGKRFETVLGKISFDGNGDVIGPGYVVYEWKDGKYDYVKN
ncbi:MAG: branched-chain amino acid ABC transporter substrate-binding protein [Gammaproteobacteria bacterium]|nr:branched-chain amino acid ABC transporter substrate-binding protein [Gammaproteobacteria bacterium]